MKQSAGILLYRKRKKMEVLIVHPGGPLWATKDDGAWSIPKGEIEPGEDAESVARKEFEEELGVPFTGVLHRLGSVKMKSGKTIQAWCAEGDFKIENFRSNYFEMEWPPRSGQKQSFPEVDKAEWFDLETAKFKLNPAQASFITMIENMLYQNSEG